MSINTETLIPGLVAEYLDSRREELGLPTAAALPFVVAPTTEDQAFPRFVLVCSDIAFPHPKRQRLTLVAELQTGVATQAIPMENEWTSCLRYALSDRSSFLAWLADQDDEKRTGYEIRKMFLADGGMAIDDDKKLRGRRTGVVIEVRTNEQA